MEQGSRRLWSSSGLNFHLFFKNISSLEVKARGNFQRSSLISIIASRSRHRISRMLRPISKNVFSKLAKGSMKSAKSVTSVSDKVDCFTVQNPKDFTERVKNSKVPVIVDFFATWCNPCRLLTPRLEAIIAERKGKVILAKVDVDENTDLALDYEVGSVPVILAMENGEVIAKLVGLQDEDKLRKFVDKILRDHEEEQVRRGRKQANPE